MSTKEKKEKYIPLTGLMGNGTDYHVYQMSFLDTIKGFGIGFGLAFAVIYIFFRSIAFSAVCGLVFGIYARKPYRNYLLRKRKETLLLQFKDLLEDLSTCYSAGENTMEAFSDCIHSLSNIYSPESDIVKEVKIVSSGMANGWNVEELLMDFAQRSGLEDIQSFADVFGVASRQGGNMKQIVSETRTIINDKITMEMEISSMLNGGKNELNILICMPVLMVLALGMDSNLSVTNNTPTNVVVKIVCLFLFAAAYIMGRKMTDIRM